MKPKIAAAEVFLGDRAAPQHQAIVAWQRGAGMVSKQIKIKNASGFDSAALGNFIRQAVVLANE